MALFECNVGGGGGGGEVIQGTGVLPPSYDQYTTINVGKPIAALKIDGTANTGQPFVGRYILGDSPTITFNGVAQANGLTIASDNKSFSVTVYRAAQGAWINRPFTYTAFCYDTLPS